MGNIFELKPSSISVSPKCHVYCVKAANVSTNAIVSIYVFR